MTGRLHDENRLPGCRCPGCGERYRQSSSVILHYWRSTRFPLGEIQTRQCKRCGTRAHYVTQLVHQVTQRRRGPDVKKLGAETTRISTRKGRRRAVIPPPQAPAEHGEHGEGDEHGEPSTPQWAKDLARHVRRRQGG